MLKAHPAADAFPMMNKKRFEELLQDIKEHGQREPITISGGQILDGRNRYKACLELGLEPITKEFDGNPWAFVWSLNGQRRDLVAEQRYLIWKFCHEQGESWAAEKQRIQNEANAKRSEAQKGIPKEDIKERVRTECPKRYDEPAKTAKAATSQTNAGAVARGDKLAKLRPDLAAKVRLGELKPAEAHRQLKKDEVSHKVAALPEGKYRVIYADPPWKYNDTQSGEISDSYGAAEKHYPSMTLAELSALDVPGITAPDAVLFLWATCPLLEDALELCRAWGFKYKAQFVWDKVRHNMGHYNSVRHELLLICTKGSCTPDNVTLFDSVQSIEKTDKHSEKPEDFRAIIETLYQHGPKIELFRRGAAPDGWSVWGNEVQ